ncbi:hypothetical protein AOQ84DRAFT_105647 [Glonium stellatum]|uniref:Uncharacterized protein n=1 Tax=Glonium stellatum TaxID=574774 RepID=A0A8E2EU88_9PEZI|nr:hypothetical protein AOQ84DRAFT_105647 [Glonium stellatum]
MAAKNAGSSEVHKSNRSWNTLCFRIIGPLGNSSGFFCNYGAHPAVLQPRKNIKHRSELLALELPAQFAVLSGGSLTMNRVRMMHEMHETHEMHESEIPDQKMANQVRSKIHCRGITARLQATVCTPIIGASVSSPSVKTTHEIDASYSGREHSSPEPRHRSDWQPKATRTC